MVGRIGAVNEPARALRGTPRPMIEAARALGRGIERFYRDVRAFRIYEGSSQIHLVNIARHLLR